MKKAILYEKLKMLTGESLWEFPESEKLGIKKIRVADGPHGLRKVIFDQGRDQTTAFPTAVNLASTFNAKLIKKVGKAIGEECKENRVDILLSPGINLKRNPLGGRNFEYYSEDPYLTGKLAYNYIKGVQQNKVGTSLKHFICNETEHYRLTTSSEVDENAFFNLYFKAFKLALAAKPYTIMASYNKLNGIYATENHYLLNELLRKKYHYQGVVISDWGAVSKLDDAINNGLNIEMPGGGQRSIDILKQSYINGKLTDEVLNQRIKEIKRLQTKIGRLNGNQINEYDRQKHLKISEEVSKESMVLLKNHGSLPLNKKYRTLFIGPFCQNLIIQATGSSEVKVETKPEVLSYLSSYKYKFDYLQGYNLYTYNIDDKLESEVLEYLSNNTDKNLQVVLFLGQYAGLEGEGYDRYNNQLPYNQLSLVSKITKLIKTLNIVLLGGSSVEMPFEKEVTAILNAQLPGEMGAVAIVDTLYGKNNPSGRLTETYPLKLEDVPSTKYFPGNCYTNYKESVYVGYRYFDKANESVLYPFGYGLSYSQFNYLNFNIESITSGNFDIENTSIYDGKEVIQIYLQKPNYQHLAPIKELVYFDKIKIKKNSKVKIKFSIDEEELKTYVNNYQDYVLLNGKYKVYVCKNARDILYEKEFNVTTGVDFVSFDVPKCYLKPSNNNITDEDFEVILGRKVMKENQEIKKYDLNTSLEEFEKTALGHSLWKKEKNWVDKTYPEGSIQKINAYKAAVSSPIKCRAIFDNDVSWEEVDLIISDANKRK